MPSIADLLKTTVDQGASDLHIAAGTPPQIRLRGSLVPLNYPILTPSDTQGICYSVITDSQKKKFEETHELDFSFSQKDVSRFRGNLYYDRGAIAGAFRVIPHEIPTMDTLGLPPMVKEIIRAPRGLVLVTGPTGSGKTTTLAAMIDAINLSRHEHIITIEDPIEYVFPHKGCLVNQREIGQDSSSFAEALKHILREDPDVVLVGEIRDMETMEAALTIAETGHLTFGTLHTNSAVQTISRVIDIFPPNQQPEVRSSLSLSLVAVLSQTLIPRIDSVGRVLAAELMIPNAAIRNLIRENKIHQIYSQLQLGQEKYGMQTLNQALASLANKRIISEEDAYNRSSDTEELKQAITSGLTSKTGINGTNMGISKGESFMSASEKAGTERSGDAGATGGRINMNKDKPFAGIDFSKL
ncbi:MAG: type IV pilus twitching motility protein PilT [Candidatus Acidulodesulfobacterium ferriphilum]|uniref:Type IV pilus twitching motility protein PilT n=1 Tax=Candidatus Acidulodesulfobacterium ferriphilum TaxID=2597223 RepID=A0A519B9I1_9DELT|nr:MAG: type IV pilus twitching motility protein PilT [Candidatus Acidulodesulfobacterium ferriphilum]